jgi:hypothetical protein
MAGHAYPAGHTVHEVCNPRLGKFAHTQKIDLVVFFLNINLA